MPISTEHLLTRFQAYILQSLDMENSWA